MKCVDQPISTYGNFQTESAKILLIIFERCDHGLRKTCKSDEELKNWLKDKYLVFAYNKQVFNSTGFKEKAINKYAWIDWLPFDINNSMLTPYTIQQSELRSFDTYLPS